MHRIYTKSLTKRALAYATFLIIIVFSSYSFYNIYSLKKQSLIYLNTNLDQRAEIQAEALSLPLWNLDDEQIKVQVRSLENDPSYCGVTVKDYSGNEVFKDEVKNTAYKKIKTQKDIFYKLGENFKKIGLLEACFTTQEVEKTVRKNIRNSIFFTFLLTFISTLIIFFTIKKITNPLVKIRKRISEINTTRNKITEDELLQYSEVAAISETFNQMIDDLNTSDESIILSNQNLEKKVEERTREITEYKNNLEKIIESRTLEIIKEKEKAEFANEMKTEFITNISHEIRTPLHAIINYSKLSLDKLATSPEKLPKYIENTISSAERLLSLINDLLDISKLETGKMEFKFEKKNILELLKYSVKEIKSLSDAKNIDVSIDCSAKFIEPKIDKNKIIQVFINLLSNSIKFSEKNTKIKISLEDSEIEDEYLTKQPSIKIKFLDEGVGIPDDELETIFDKFNQSSKTKTGAGGTGLGLSISKDIVLSHKGKIYAENNIGGGSCITIELLQNF